MKSLLSKTVPPTERLLNTLTLLLLIGQIVLVFGYYFHLPEVIPVHFGRGGKPDRYPVNEKLIPTISLSYR